MVLTSYSFLDSQAMKSLSIFFFFFVAFFVCSAWESEAGLILEPSDLFDLANVQGWPMIQAKRAMLPKAGKVPKWRTALHSGMFCKVLFHCENVGRQDDLANFWHFFTWIQAFFNPIEFLGLKKVNWVEKRLKSCEKMSKLSKIILSADVFLTKQNHGKHSTVPYLYLNSKCTNCLFQLWLNLVEKITWL